MSDIYRRKEDLGTAFTYAERSLELAHRSGLNSQIRDANMKMAELHEALNDSAAAYRYFKNHIIYRDSIRNLEVVERMADDRTNFEVSQKQMEVDLLEQKRQNQRLVIFAIAGALASITILAFGLYRRYQFIQKTKKIIENERDRSDRLLLNILPEETAEELKEYGKVKAKQYDSVTVMFSDFKGFTSYSEKLSPDALVETIGFYFSKFDDIMETYGLEKIKTIGDAYMCAGGLRENDKDHAERVVKACKDIVDFMEVTRKDASASELNFDIRIGINTGPVVAGVVGTKKFAYDIWGDTVNVAARMESMSQPGKINISQSTYELLKDKWNCEYRGTFKVKNRGSMNMYFVKEQAQSTP
jgi:class 3 adenylate cyclase